MENFEQKIIDTVRKGILNDLNDVNYFKRWVEQPMSVPHEVVKEAYAGIDMDKMINQVRENIEGQIVKTITGQLLTETATDTKKIMSDPETRQGIRNKVYPVILQAINKSE
jgi:hypothetical protein